MISAEHKRTKICELQYFGSFVGRNVTVFPPFPLNGVQIT